MLLIRVSISIFGLQALLRKPDYPKVLERRARLIDRQVDQETTQKKSGHKDGEGAKREPQETKQRHQHDHPQPQEREGARRWTKHDEAHWYADDERRAWVAKAEERRRAAAVEEERTGVLRSERLAQEERVQQERIKRFVEADWGQTVEGEEARRQYQEDRSKLFGKIRGHEERKRQAEYGAEGVETSGESVVEGDHWWEAEQQRVQQKVQDEIKREQKQREEEHQMAQLKKQKEAMMHYKLAAERQREEAAKEDERIRYVP